MNQPLVFTIKVGGDIADLKTAMAQAEAAVAQASTQMGADAARGTQASAQAAQAAARGFRDTAQAATMSAGQTRAAMAQLPMQLTDVFTSLAGGQNPLLVLIQQGGQVRDSFGGIGNALRAIGSIITPASLAMGGLAVTAGVVGAAFVAGSREADRLARSMALTGNAAGLTSSSFVSLAQSVQQASGATEAAAREAVAAVVSMGTVGPQAVGPVAAAMAAYARLAGKSVDEVADQFSRLRDDATGWAMEMSRTTNFLTAATFMRIRALKDQGQNEQAAAVAAQALADEAERRNRQLEQNLSGIGRAAREARDFLSGMWTAAKGIGQAETADENIAKLRQRVRELEFAARPTAGGGLIDNFFQGRAAGQLGSARTALAQAEEDQRRSEAAAADEAARAAAQRRQVAALNLFQPDVTLSALPRTAAQVQRETELTVAAIQRSAAAARDAAAGNAGLLATINAQARDAIAITQREGADALAALANAASEKGRAAAAANIDAQVAAAKRASDALVREADAREIALQDARSRGLISERDAVLQSAQLEQDRIDAKRVAIEREIALEARRPMVAGDPAGAVAQRARIEGLRGELEALSAESAQVAARAANDASRALFDEANARFEETSRVIDTARAQADQLQDQTRRTLVGLIADPVARATAEAEADIADLERSAARLQQSLRLALVRAQIDDPNDQTGQQAQLRDQIGQVQEQTNAAIVARNQRLALDLKPAWQSMLDGWRDTTRLMRDQWDTTFSGMVNAADSALTGFFRTGKFNGGAIVDNLLNGMASTLSRQALGSINLEGIGGAAKNATGFGGGDGMKAAWTGFAESLKNGTVLQDAWNLITRTSQATEQSASMSATASLTALAAAANAASVALGGAAGASAGGGGPGTIATLLSKLFSPSTPSAGTNTGTAALPNSLPGGNDYPGFAAGGDHMGGWRVVGESGPELEATGRARVFSAADTRRILAGGAQGVTVQNQIQVINNAQGVTVREQQAAGPDGSQITQLIVEQATNAARSTIAREVSEGRGIASVFEGRYGLRPSNMPRMA